MTLMKKKYIGTIFINSLNNNAILTQNSATREKVKKNTYNFYFNNYDNLRERKFLGKS